MGIPAFGLQSATSVATEGAKRVVFEQKWHFKDKGSKHDATEQLLRQRFAAVPLLLAAGSPRGARRTSRCEAA